MGCCLKRIKCTLCGSRVTDSWERKWKHIVKVHPEVMTRRLLPMLENPRVAYDFGVWLGERFKVVLE